MSRESRLLKNTIIYSVGNLGTKILNFLIVPLYTYYIKPEDYGTYDLLCTAITLLIPFVTLQLSEAIICWMLDEKNNKKSVVHCILNILLVNMVLTIVVFSVGTWLFDIPYRIYVMILLLAKSFCMILQQITRGLANNKLYTVSGILYSIIFLSINVFVVVVLRVGIEGLLISDIISSAVISVFLLLLQPEILKSFKVSYDRGLKKDLIKYSLPLIPNSVSWWIINLSDRLVIKLFLGNAANGLYALSNKFPAIVQVLTNVFNLAWQETAILTYEHKDRENFYGGIFKMYYKMLFSVGLIAISFTEFAINLILSTSYQTSWKYTSFLYLGAVYSSFASFYNMSYLKEKNTKGILGTTVVAAVVNIFINLILVEKIGLQAASVSTFVSSLVLFIVRVIGTRRSCPIKVSWVHFSLFAVISVGYAVVFSMENLIIIKITMMIVGIGIALVSNFSLLKEIVRKVVKKVNRN